jgi:hypothetical protein
MIGLSLARIFGPSVHSSTNLSPRLARRTTCFQRIPRTFRSVFLRIRNVLPIVPEASVHLRSLIVHLS